MNDTKAAAFFDLDRTIISGSSLVAFGLAAWRAEFVPTRDLLGDLVNGIVFRVTGGSDTRSTAVRQRVLDAIAGHSVEELRDLGSEVVPKLLDHVRREARGLIDLHHDAGRHSYIVSASPVEIVARLAEAMGMTGGIGTVAEIRDGLYTGQLSEPFCYGPGKADAIAKLAAQRGYDLDRCYAYTDSISDLPMLELVGHPVAVNPDRALEETAYHRGWPVIEFSRTAKRVISRTTALIAAGAASTAAYLFGRRHGRTAAAAATTGPLARLAQRLT